MGTPENDFGKELEKIRKKLVESEGMNLEAYRRYQVANEKLAGYLIEAIESQRGKLKGKPKVGRLLGILLRISDLRTQVILKILREQASKELTNPVLLQNMENVYKGITDELCDFLLKEDAKSPNLPSLSIAPLLTEDRLSSLNVCLGQLQGLVLGRLYEYIF